MTKKVDLNSMCPIAANALVGSMLEALRDAVNLICSNIDTDNGTIGADYVTNCITATGLADAGTYDLDT